MEFKNIYLVRHGAISIDESQKSFIGQIDLPMSDEGHAQVDSLCRRIGKIKISSVFCSDLMRSAATAEKIAALHGITPVLKSGLREISLGDWEGLTFAEVINLYPDEFKQRGDDIVNFKPPYGESFYDLRQRVVASFEDIVHSSTGNIVVAGHAGVNRLLLCHVLGMPIENLFRISQDYGCLNVIFAGNSLYRVTLLNDTGNIKQTGDSNGN